MRTLSTVTLLIQVISGDRTHDPHCAWSPPWAAETGKLRRKGYDMSRAAVPIESSLPQPKYPGHPHCRNGYVMAPVALEKKICPLFETARSRPRSQ